MLGKFFQFLASVYKYMRKKKFLKDFFFFYFQKSSFFLSNFPSSSLNLYRKFSFFTIFAYIVFAHAKEDGINLNVAMLHWLLHAGNEYRKSSLNFTRTKWDFPTFNGFHFTKFKDFLPTAFVFNFKLLITVDDACNETIVD